MPKMSNKWVAICTAAVGITYAAGYAVTQPAGAQASTTTPSKVTASNQKQASPDQNSNNESPKAYYRGDGGSQYGEFGHHHGGRFGGYGNDSEGQGPSSNGDGGNSSDGSSELNNGASSGSSSADSSSASSSSSAKTAYKDGTYTGTGENRYGTVSVSVTVKSHKITAVKITNCDTHYPEDAITGLPQQVVDQQSANVDIVSGATGSSEDFQQAVSQALQSAQS